MLTVLNETHHSPYTVTITPPDRFFSFNGEEIWHFRDLLYIFVWRDIKVRYKQTALGVLWAILQPFLTMLIFTVFFGKLAKIPSDNVPYPIFVYTGLLIWTYFSMALTSTSNCMIESESIIKKVYFPRLILPLSTVVTPLIDFSISMLVLFGLMAYYGYKPHILGIVIIPLLLLISLLTALGLGLFLAAVNVKYRDARYLLPFLLQMLLFMTPVIYPASIVENKYPFLLTWNPLAGAISAARSTLLHSQPLDWHALLISFAVSILFFFAGLIYFNRNERYFADIL